MEGKTTCDASVASTLAETPDGPCFVTSKVVLGPEVGGPRAHSIHHGNFDMQTSISLQHSFIARLKDESLFSMRLITKKFRSRTVGYRARFP
jgi:hypothetical protein